MNPPLPIEGLQATIAYLYLLAFCPPDTIRHLKQAAEPLRRGLAQEAGLTEAEYFGRVLPEACRRIVTFQQANREPDEETVAALTQAAAQATESPENAAHFSRLMAQLAADPARAKPKNRLQRKQGCQLCQAACHYGYFALITQPDYETLSDLLKAEAEKPPAEQDVVSAVWSFAAAQLWRALGSEQSYIAADHLGNLAYCYLTLGTAKSRYPFPEAAMTGFQQANQAAIQRWGKYTTPPESLFR